MYFADLFKIGGAYFAINFKSPLAVSRNDFRTTDPWVVVAENARVFFVAARVGRYFPEVYVIFFIGGL